MEFLLFVADYAGRSGMQWHADFTLASYVARKNDELMSSGRIAVVVVPLLLEQKLPTKFAIPLNPPTMCTRHAGVLQLICFLDHTRVATNQPTSTLWLRLVSWPVASEVGWLRLRRIFMRNITYIENLPIPLHPTNQPTTLLRVGWLVNQPTGQPLATVVGW